MTAKERRGRRGEAGDTLIELVVTVVLMGLAIVGIIAGIGSAVSLSETHRSQADVSAALTSASEFLKAEPYQNCLNNDALNTYKGDLSTNFASAYPQTEADVSTPTVTAVTNTSGGDCSTANPDPGMEIVTIQATSLSGRVTQIVYLIKANNR